jgi:exodeoxyribonuclease VII large subunit
VRTRLAATTRRLLDHRAERVALQTATLTRQAPRSLEHAASAIEARTSRLRVLARSHLDRSSDHIEQWRRLLVAYDVDRQLERGYTLTLDHDGRVLRRAAGLEVGTVLSTRFADGRVHSVVDRLDASAGQEDEEM